ncbi:ComF family protein [Pedobacter yulinensis]|uniref:ComF family protein n=1 Tax=Pedobacter yulinensis TaxID=2126353 RepID=A0A2T3HNP5_9SPHI|nr:phosphoribosyltransferase family protein [Pedobacter yulinensis]PST84072.1 ComF family protein [Pedobacter yulinensis]
MKAAALLYDFSLLLFPEPCQACGKPLFRGETLICTDCIYNLPYTDYHTDPENRLARQFWGRVPLAAATALLYFRKGGRVQTLLHRLKYGHKPELARLMGTLLARQLMQSALTRPDDVIPVPMYKRNERKRGYNQSWLIAAGLCATANLLLSDKVLVKTQKTSSQTRRSRFSRYENMRQVFELQPAANINGRHVLLIDDVVTTGSTAEACALVLLGAGAASVSLATLAFTE